jgi:hypothetical protein
MTNKTDCSEQSGAHTTNPIAQLARQSSTTGVFNAKQTRNGNIS